GATSRLGSPEPGMARPRYGSLQERRRRADNRDVTAATSTLRERAPIPLLAGTAIAGVLFGQPLYLAADHTIHWALPVIGVRAALATCLLASRAGLATKIARGRNRVIVESIVEGIWLVDSDGRTAYVNSQMAALVGWAADDMVGRP